MVGLGNFWFDLKIQTSLVIHQQSDSFAPFFLSCGRDIRAVYTRENKQWLTLAEAHIRCERNHLYEYGLYQTRTARINGSRLSSRPGCAFDKRRFKIKIGKLTLAEVAQTSSCPAISSSLHMSRICFSFGALTHFFFYMNLYPPFSTV